MKVELKVQGFRALLEPHRGKHSSSVALRNSEIGRVGGRLTAAKIHVQDRRFC